MLVTENPLTKDKMKALKKNTFPPLAMEESFLQQLPNIKTIYVEWLNHSNFAYYQN